MKDFIAMVGSQMLPTILELGGIVLAVVLARVSLAAKNRLGLDIEKRHQDALHSALMSEVRAALQRRSVGDAIVTEAVKYAQSSVPDAIAKLSPAGAGEDR